MTTHQRDERYADRVGHDPLTGRFHAHYRADRETLCFAVAEAVAAATEESPDEMDPLWNAIDPDALEAVLHSAGPGNVRVDFAYNGCVVTATAGGDVVVERQG